MSTASFLGGAVLAAGVILKAEEENALLNGPSYIQSGVPRDFTGKIGQQLARRACLQYANNPSGVPEARQLQYERACRPYLDSQKTGTGPTGYGGFEGGQCAVPYIVSGTWQSQSTGSGVAPVDSNWIDGTWVTLQTTSAPRGPIRGLSRDTSGAFQRVTLLAGPDGQVIGYDLFPPGGGGQVYYFAGTTRGGTTRWVRNVSITSIARRDGLPDNCGDAPPVVEPPNPDPTPSPPRAPIVIAPDINIDASVTVNAIGAVVINLGLGPVTIDPFGDDSGGGDGGGSGGGPGPGDIGLPGLPTGVGAGSDADGESPPGQVIGALRLNIQNTPPSHKLVAPGVYRGACYCYLGTSSGLDLDPAGGLLRDGQMVFPELPNLTHWRVAANRGFDILVTPYYVDVTE